MHNQEQQKREITTVENCNKIGWTSNLHEMQNEERAEKSRTSCMTCTRRSILLKMFHFYRTLQLFGDFFNRRVAHEHGKDQHYLKLAVKWIWQSLKSSFKGKFKNVKENKFSNLKI